MGAWITYYSFTHPSVHPSGIVPNKYFMKLMMCLTLGFRGKQDRLPAFMEIYILVETTANTQWLP
jgi:hypothetical protein